MISLARRADLAIYDSTFTDDEIKSKAGWGHSTWTRGVRMANEAEVKHLCLFHHDPSTSDALRGFHGQARRRRYRWTCGNDCGAGRPDYRFVTCSTAAVATARVPCWSNANKGR